MRHGRKFWTKLVERFETEGGRERHQRFADRHGVQCDTFRRWLYLLRSERHGRRWCSSKAALPAATTALPLVEVQPVRVADARFEIELRDGVRVHVPATFEAETLRRLLALFTNKPSS